jgi:hypothetical protein
MASTYLRSQNCAKVLGDETYISPTYILHAMLSTSPHSMMFLRIYYSLFLALVILYLKKRKGLASRCYVRFAFGNGAFQVSIGEAYESVGSP